MKTILLSSILGLILISCDTTVPDEETKQSVANEETEQDNADEKTETGITNKPKLTLKWSTDSIMATPESVLFHNDVLYVSNINGKNPLEKDGNGFISKLNLDGSIQELKWAVGMNAPKGMTINGNKLYVTDIDRLIEIELSNGEISKQYEIKGAIFLNDLTTHNNVVYFSDMKTNIIHQLKDGEITTLLKKMKSVNGLLADENSLFALTEAGLQAMNYETGKVATLNESVKGGDGLVRIKDGSMVASKWVGEIYHIADQTTLLLDTKSQKTQTADIGYYPEQNLILVPTFFGNRVCAYELSYE